MPLMLHNIANFLVILQQTHRHDAHQLSSSVDYVKINFNQSPAVQTSSVCSQLTFAGEFV